MVTRRRIIQAAALLPLASCAVTGGLEAPFLTAAPLAGHMTPTSVRLWLQSSTPARATIRFWPESGAPSNGRDLHIDLPLDADNSGILEVNGLTANTRYRYQIALNGTPGGNGLFRTAPVAPLPFRLYLGSCAYTETLLPNGYPYGDGFDIFDNMAAKMAADNLPHFMLWLGDNLYLRPKGIFLATSDVASAAQISARYRSVRAMPMFQKLFAATHHYAIWDDHDFGPNDADKSFRLKSDALQVFKRYWPNPDMGSNDLPGTWTSFVHQDAEFFFLDDRTYRDAEAAPASETKSMFGRAQLTWLKNSLAASTATFKIICNGSQLWSENDNGVTSGWHSYATERNQFLAWLSEQKLAGLLFLSGDRHNTQVFRLKHPNAPVAYEFSCSPFTSRLSQISKRERANPRFVEALAVEQRNFGTLEFVGSGATRKIVAASFDTSGRQLWRRVLASATVDRDFEPV